MRERGWGTLREGDACASLALVVRGWWLRAALGFPWRNGSVGWIGIVCLFFWRLAIFVLSTSAVLFGD